MFQLEAFWEIRFVDFIPIISAILSPLIIYWVYKKLNKIQEIKRIEAIFIRFKKYLESSLPENKNNVAIRLAFNESSFLKSQIEYLVKIGLVLIHTDNISIGGSISDDFIKLSLEPESPVFIILDKYMFTGEVLSRLNKGDEKHIDASKEEYEKVLEEMIVFSKNYFRIKINKKLAKIK